MPAGLFDPVNIRVLILDQARGATILGARLPQLPIEIEEREHHSSLRRRARHQSQANKRVMRYVNCCWLLIDG
jgi:hypothetical protein